MIKKQAVFKDTEKKTADEYTHRLCIITIFYF